MTIGHCDCCSCLDRVHDVPWSDVRCVYGSHLRFYRLSNLLLGRILLHKSHYHYHHHHRRRHHHHHHLWSRHQSSYFQNFSLRLSLSLSRVGSATRETGVKVGLVWLWRKSEWTANRVIASVHKSVQTFANSDKITRTVTASPHDVRRLLLEHVQCHH